jgi:hypothetical protein
MTMFSKTAAACVLAAIILASWPASAAGVNRVGINGLRTGGSLVGNGAVRGRAPDLRGTSNPFADRFNDVNPRELPGQKNATCRIRPL